MKLRLLESFVAVVLISISAAVWSSKRLLSPNLNSKISQRSKCCFSVVKAIHYAGRRNIKRLNSMNEWSCSEVPNEYQSVLDRMLLSLTSILVNKQSKTESDAAGFQKHCSRFRVDIPDNIIPTDVNINRLDPSIDCVVFIAAKNNVGDPVINEIRKIRKTYPNLCGLLINCDLSDKVLSGGMKGKAERDSFRTSISPAFYFRNIVSISRPSMEPTELGMMIYTVFEGWKLYAVNSQDIDGPGSLNRFMSQAVFLRSPSDPTAENPPRFLEVYSDPEVRPSKEDVSGMETRVKVILSRSRQQPQQPVDDKAALVNKQPNFLQSFLDSINSQLRRVVQDDGTAPITAPAIEVGDDVDWKGEAASTSTSTSTTAALKESERPPSPPPPTPSPGSNDRMTMLDLTSLDP